VNGQLDCQGGPIIYLQDDFANNDKGWQLGPEWEIKPAAAGCDDPGTDTTPTADNGVAGVVVGGCSTSSLSGNLHPMYFLTSPAINTANAPAVYLRFMRWLNSDYTPYMNNVIEVFDGSTWVKIWESGYSGAYDSSWQKISHDISAYKNANMQIRFGFDIDDWGVYSVGSWNIDDVLVTSAPCP
jgi:hypothetical protein